MGAFPCGFESRLSYHFNIMTFNDICNDPDLWIEHVEQDLDMYNSMNLQERLDFVETLFHYESEN